MTDGLLYDIYQAGDRFSKHGFHESAALAYYAVFSLFPLLILLLVVVSTVQGPAAARDQIDGVLRLFVPVSTADFVQENIAESLEQRGSFGLMAGITLLWSGLGLFSNLNSALNRTFGVASFPNTFKRRLIALFMMLALGLLLIASLATTVLFGLIDLVFFFQTSSWVTTGALLVPLSINIAIFAFLYRFLPRRRVRWDTIWTVAFLCGIAWEIAKEGFAWYLDNLGSYNWIYGSVATLIVLMLWAFVTGIIVIFGGELCVSLEEWMTRRSVQDLIIASTELEEEYELVE